MLLFAAAAAALLVASCSKVGLQTNTTTNNYTIPGTLRYADITEPSNLNPLLRLEAGSTDIDMFVFGFFFNLDDKMHYVPELATEVPTLQNGGISRDGLTLTYHLRHGVKWHDGAPFTAHDVVFTVHAILNPANNVQSRNGWDKIASVEALDPYTVRFHLKQIYGAAVSSYFSEGGDYPVLPAHLLEQYPNINQVPFNTQPIGTGPFKFVRWVHGDHIELVANPNYWRGAPGLQHIIYKIIPRDTTILVQLRTHEIDAWFRAPSNLFNEYHSLQGYRVQLAPSLVYSHMDFNLKNPLFQDVRVRQAINYAIDKQQLINAVTHGVQLLNWSVESPLAWAYNPNVKHYPFNPALARQLLAQAGWVRGPDGVLVKNGQRFTFNMSAVAGGSTGEATEALVQQMLRAVGIDAKVKNYPANLFFAGMQSGGILQGGKYDVAFYAWVAGDDPSGEQSLYACDYMPPQGQNTLYWCDQTVTNAENQGLLSYDQNVRARWYRIAQAEIAEQSPTIVTWFQRQIFITSTNLDGFVPAPATSSNWNSWKWTMR